MMQLQISAAELSLLRKAVECGHYVNEQDALSDAIAQWDERRRRSVELLLAIEQAEDLHRLAKAAAA